MAIKDPPHPPRWWDTQQDRAFGRRIFQWWSNLTQEINSHGKPVEHTATQYNFTGTQEYLRYTRSNNLITVRFSFLNLGGTGNIEFSVPFPFDQTGILIGGVAQLYDASANNNHFFIPEGLNSPSRVGFVQSSGSSGISAAQRLTTSNPIAVASADVLRGAFFYYTNSP